MQTSRSAGRKHSGSTRRHEFRERLRGDDKTLDFYQRLGLTLLRTSGPNADGLRSARYPGGKPGAQRLFQSRKRLAQKGESRRHRSLLPHRGCRVGRRCHRRLATGRDRYRPWPCGTARRHGSVRPRSGRGACGTAAPETGEAVRRRCFCGWKFHPLTTETILMSRTTRRIVGLAAFVGVAMTAAAPGTAVGQDKMVRMGNQRVGALRF
jgi:hypothetical protein